MRDERFAQLSDAAVRLLADRAVQELRFGVAQQQRALREITALRDEMIHRLRRRGDDVAERTAGVERGHNMVRRLMTAADLPAWLDAYLAAWRSYDAAAISALFASDARYAYHPYDEPLQGRDAIVASWLQNRDAPGAWEATYAPALIDGRRAVATGTTRYRTGEVFSNLFQLAFDEQGRCTRFVEWYIAHPAP